MENEINLFSTEEEETLSDSLESQQNEAQASTQTIAESDKPSPQTANSFFQPSEKALSITKQIELQQQQATRKQAVKSCIEALLFSSDSPLNLNKIREVTDTLYPFKPRVIQELIQALQLEYAQQKRGFLLEEIAQGYILRTSPDFSAQLAQLHNQKRIERLSQASTEVLAIISYKQPITRAQVDSIRGVDSSGALSNLLERDLVEPVGKQNSPGRPTLYGTTSYFLQYFGLKDLSELQSFQNTELLEQDACVESST